VVVGRAVRALLGYGVFVVSSSSAAKAVIAAWGLAYTPIYVITPRSMSEGIR
jgi:hypothetical protein